MKVFQWGYFYRFSYRWLSSDADEHNAYNEELGKDNVAEVDVGEGVTQWSSTEGRDERMQSCVTVYNVGIIVSREQWQQARHAGQVRLPSDRQNVMKEQRGGHHITSAHSTSVDTPRHRICTLHVNTSPSAYADIYAYPFTYSIIAMHVHHLGWYCILFRRIFNLQN